MEQTHFGFETVPVADKADRVRAVFDSVAPNYDLMNDLMSVACTDSIGSALRWAAPASGPGMPRWTWLAARAISRPAWPGRWGPWD